MRHPGRLARIAGLALIVLPVAARAAQTVHPSVSYSTWIVAPSERTVTLRYRLPKRMARQLAGSSTVVVTVNKVGQYVLAHTAVRNAGRDCPASDQGYDLGRVDPLDVGPRLYGFELVFRCARPLGELALIDSALFARNRAHIDFARIQRGRHFSDELFTAAREHLRVQAHAALPSASITRYLKLGWRHVSTSPLRLAFLLIALILVRSLRNLGEFAVGLTTGYVLSYLAQASGWFEPRMALLDGFIGALVALGAVWLAMLATDRPRLIRIGWPSLLVILGVVALWLRTPQAALLLIGFAAFSAGFLRLQSEQRRLGLWLAASLYGFFDGWVLPALLGPVHLVAAARAAMVVGYDLGAVLAAAMFAALVAGAAFALLKVGFLEVVRPAVQEAAAACLAGLGVFWLLASAAQTIPPAGAGKAKPSIVETLAHVDQTTVNPDSLLMRNYYLMGNTLIPMSEKPKD